jgi:hypothetical protein
VGFFFGFVFSIFPPYFFDITIPLMRYNGVCDLFIIVVKNCVVGVLFG